jgi:hypothetical protein
MAEELLGPDEHIQKSEAAEASGEIARESGAGILIGGAIGALMGLAIGAVLFGFPGGDQTSRDTTLFLVSLIVSMAAGAVAGFVFGGGRGVRDARRQAEAEARGRAPAHR